MVAQLGLRIAHYFNDALWVMERAYNHLNGRLMDEPVGANPVPSSMSIVESRLQEMAPGQVVQPGVRGALRERGSGQVNGSQQDTCVGGTMEAGGLTKVECSGCVGSAIYVLTTCKNEKNIYN